MACTQIDMCVYTRERANEQANEAAAANNNNITFHPKS